MEIFAPGMAFKGLVGAFQIEGEKRNELSYSVLYAECVHRSMEHVFFLEYE